MKWNKINKPVPDGIDRVLVYTPNKDATMQYRVVDPKFLKTFSDATHWAALMPPDSDENWEDYDHKIVGIDNRTMDKA